MTCHFKAPLLFLGGLGLLLAVPRNLDDSSDYKRPEAKNAQSSKEGLYKSRLTKSNFGMLGFHLYESKEGEKHWNIQSQFAEFDRKQDLVNMEVVDAAFYAESTGNVVKTSSKTGESLLGEEKVYLKEDVSIRSRRGYLFEMDTLDYEGSRHEFHTLDKVQMRGPDVNEPRMFLKGVGLLAQIDEELFKLKSNVTGRRLLSSNEWIEINSRRGEFYSESQKAIFLDKVNSKLPGMEIKSDRFEIVMSGGDSIGESLLAQGSVKVKTGNKVGRANKAFIEVGKDVVVLEGNAMVESKGNRISGRRIEMFTSEDRIRVVEASGRGKLASEN